jgi:serine/threonine protein kinase/Tfp pilus assembly protein PilF
MGVVYRARDTRLDRQVAVKVLPDAFAQDPNRRARFEREAKAVAALSHPNILAIHDVGIYEEMMYAVMELLEGETLRGRLTKGAMPWREAIEVGAAIADGLAAAHARRIVHRDLKPENLFLTCEGRLKILDFGLARVEPITGPEDATAPYPPARTDPGILMGTVGYMSPEQVLGQSADTRSDIFSLGCVLHEMLTGRRAFLRDSVIETLTAILHDEPTGSLQADWQVPTALDRLIRQCLAKNPAERRRTARDLACALRSIANQSDHPGPATRHAIEALAVLPFENVGGDVQKEFLSDGLADHLIISLSRVRPQGLKVRPFSSVSRYRRTRMNAVAIGRELRVQVLITGTVHQPGEDLWISVAIADAREDNQLWGKRYHGKLAGILDLLDQIASDVAAELGLNLNQEEARQLTRRYTEEPEAYVLYCEAKYHWNKFTEVGLETSIEYCRRALAKDPNYALANFGLGRSFHVLGAVHRGWHDMYGEAKRQYDRSLAIDDTLAEAYTGLAVLHLMHDWDWSAAKQTLERAMALNPADANIWEITSFWHASQGQLSEALATARRALELDPLSARTSDVVAMCLNWMRRYDEAIAESRRMIELDPGFPFAYPELGLALIAKLRADDAISELQKALGSGHTHPRVQGMLGCAYAAAARRSEAARVANDMKQQQDRFGVAFPISRIYAVLGELDEAFAWLQKARDERDSAVIWLKVDPTLDNLRADPRFSQRLQDMGLPP